MDPNTSAHCLARFLWALPLMVFTGLQAHADDPVIFHPQESGVSSSLRGLFVVSDDVAWASGADGTVLRTLDAGQSWESVAVPNSKQFDFRDIHAWDEQQAVVISAGSPAHVYRTEDGGKSWTLVFENNDAKIFFDAMDFFDGDRGIAFSDPQEGRLVLIETLDGGRSWKQIPPEDCPKTLAAEAGFAASGTCLTTDDRGQVWIGLGGGEEDRPARVLMAGDYGRGWHAVQSPLPANAASGIFSLVMANSQFGVAVGGDYQQADKASGNWAVTADGGKSWTVPEGPAPAGYRSGIATTNLNNTLLFVAVGTNGADAFIKDGNEWTALPTENGYHAVCFAPSGRVGWVSGADGRIARFESAAIVSFLQQPEVNQPEVNQQ